MSHRFGCNKSWLSAPLLALLGLPMGLKAQAGVVVEQVEKSSEAEAAGVRAGDNITGWSQGTAEGKFDSPFDWGDFEIEWLPRGNVTLRGLRDSQGQTWMLPNGTPGITVRPVLREDLTPLWQRYREMEMAGKFAEAGEGWRGMIGQIGSSDPPWLAAWLQFQLARALARARQFAESDTAAQMAIDQATTTVANGAVTLLLAWGKLFTDRSDWARAEDCYQRGLQVARKPSSPSLLEATSLHGLAIAFYRVGNLDGAGKSFELELEIRRKLASNSLDYAATLNGLANVAHERGTLERAVQYHRQALAIRQRLAPGSLDVAGSLNNLGNVELDRGNLEQAAGYLEQALAIKQKSAPGSLDLAATLNVCRRIRSRVQAEYCHWAGDGPVRLR